MLLTVAPRIARASWLVVELGASVLTIAGMFIGSTTASGAAAYLAAQPFWFAIIIGRRVWGILPLTVTASVVCAVNLWRAL